MRLAFTVIGKPEPAGSKRAFVIPGTHRATVSDANKKSAPWKQEVASRGHAEHGDRPLMGGPLAVSFRFYRVRPAGHTGSKGLTKAGRETPYPVSKPDALKLARGIEDALTGVVYRDDAQIVEEHLFKFWGEPARVEIEIEELGEERIDPRAKPILDALKRAVGE